MSYLVDGDNLLGRWPDRERSGGERIRLSHELQRHATKIRRKILVCFDGTKPPNLHAGAHSHWSGAALSADEWILNRLKKEPNPRGWTVVTDDRSLGDRCRYIGAKLESCLSFRRKLTSQSKSAKPETEEDIDFWLKTFEETD